MPDAKVLVVCALAAMLVVGGKTIVTKTGSSVEAVAVKTGSVTKTAATKTGSSVKHVAIWTWKRVKK